MTAVLGRPRACGLVRHDIGRRVQFTRWSDSKHRIETVRGVVVTHSRRTVTVRLDSGEEVWTSCGHVAGES